MADARSVVFVDAGGLATIVLFRTTTGGATIMSDMQAISNAGILNWWEGGLVVPANAPIAATYAAINQVANLVFRAVDNTNVLLRVPAPKLSIFLSDGQSVDPAAIATLIGDCIGTLLSPSLSPAASFVSGTLRRPP